VNRALPAAVLLFVCLLASGGCPSSSPTRVSVNAYGGRAENLARLQRVVLIELTPRRCPPEIAESMTEALFAALQGRKLFHVDLLARTDSACRDLPLDKPGTFTSDEMKVMRKKLGCDAVLLGSVRGFQTYPRMQMGLYLRLVDLEAGTVTWGVDHTTWDTTDKNTEREMKEFFDKVMREGYAPANWRIARMSPRTFQKFVAWKIVETLPTVEEIAARRTGRPRR